MQEGFRMRSWLLNMVSACWRPVEHYLETFTDGANSQQDNLLWDKGLQQHATGDFSIAVVQANELLEDQSQVHTGPHGTYIGVYDGHGGPEASRFITGHLFAKIEKFTQEQGGMSSEVLKKAFSATEEEFLGLVDKYWRAKPHIAAVGSCCLLGVISEKRLYIANLGDSRAVLGTSEIGNKGVIARRLSTEHNAAIETVREELKAQHPDDSNIVVLRHGVWRVKGIIQVSRSIGDVYLKKPELNRDPFFSHIGFPVPLKKPVLTAEPSISEHILHPEHRFLIFASDGLWEHMTDQQAVNIVNYHPRPGIAKRLIRFALQEAAKKQELRYSELKKIVPGLRRNFHDDITVVVVFLDHDLIKMKGRSFPLRIASDNVDAPLDVFSSDDLVNKAVV